MQINLNKYQEFVSAVTSNESKQFSSFSDRLEYLDKDNTLNISLLLTSAIGMAAETGEFCEIPKKILFQGKPVTEETVFHMKRELGDVLWYWINACTALNLDPNDVIAENINKLSSRYPGGNFSAFYSENRQQGDL